MFKEDDLRLKQVQKRSAWMVRKNCNKRELEESSLFISLAEERLGEDIVLTNISQEKCWGDELLKGQSSS